MSDHLDALEKKLDELDYLAVELRAMAVSLPVVLRKARARIRALRREEDTDEPCYREADGRCGAHCPDME